MKRVSVIMGAMLLGTALNCAAVGGVSQGVVTIKGSATAEDGTKTSFDATAFLSNSTNVLVAVVDTTPGTQSVSLEEQTPGGTFVQEVGSLNKLSVVATSASPKFSAEWTLTFNNGDSAEVVIAGTVKGDKNTFLATSLSGKAAGPSDRGVLAISISAKNLTPPPG